MNAGRPMAIRIIATANATTSSVRLNPDLLFRKNYLSSLHSFVDKHSGYRLPAHPYLLDWTETSQLIRVQDR